LQLPPLLDVLSELTFLVGTCPDVSLAWMVVFPKLVSFLFFSPQKDPDLTAIFPPRLFFLSDLVFPLPIYYSYWRESRGLSCGLCFFLPFPLSQKLLRGSDSLPPLFRFSSFSLLSPHLLPSSRDMSRGRASWFNSVFPLPRGFFLDLNVVDQ